MSGKSVLKLAPLLLGSLLILITLIGVKAAPFEPINYPNPVYPSSIKLEVLGTYRVGFFNTMGAEIVAHDWRTQRLFVVNAAVFPANNDNGPPQKPRLDVLNIRNPAKPELEFFIDLSEVFCKDPPLCEDAVTTVPTSVAVRNGIVAVAVHKKLHADGTVPDILTQAPGKVLFYEAGGHKYDKPVNVVEIFGLPDMVTFSPNGRWVLTANIASLSTPGSVGVIRFKRRGRDVSLRLADFSGFDLSNLPVGVRYIPGFPVALALSPEYIAISRNSRTASVTLEVNNAIAVVDIKNAEVTDIFPLGSKDHNLVDNGFRAFDGVPGSNALDPSDEDGGANINNWPVFGMYQPDAIAAYRTWGGEYLVTANEGNTFDDNLEKVLARQLPLCRGAAAAGFLADDQLGKLKVTRLPLIDYGFNPFNPSGPCFTDLYAYGARSFSIWSPQGRLVFDSGDDFEQITNLAIPGFFNADDNENKLDVKSDDSGPEPEGVTVGRVFGRVYAFVVLERIGGVMVYDITNPKAPRFQQYINNRDFSVNIRGEGEGEGVCKNGMKESDLCAAVRDLGPEGVLFINRFASPIKAPLLVVANETSGSTTIYRINRVKKHWPYK